MSVRALAAIFGCSFCERLRHPAETLGFAVLLPALLFVFASLWKTTSRGQWLGGWTPAQLVLYLLVTELVTMSPGWAHQAIAASVRSGDVAGDLLRPVHWVPMQLARTLGNASARFLVLLASGGLAVLALTGAPRLDARGVLALAVLLPMAVALDCCARVLVGLLAFWFEESSPFFWIWQKLSFVMGGLMIPLDLYPAWLRSVAECLPFSAMIYGPARALVAFDAHEAASALARLAAWLVVAVLALLLTFGRAGRRLALNGG